MVVNTCVELSVTSAGSGAAGTERRSWTVLPVAVLTALDSWSSAFLAATSSTRASTYWRLRSFCSASEARSYALLTRSTSRTAAASARTQLACERAMSRSIDRIAAANPVRRAIARSSLPPVDSDNMGHRSLATRSCPAACSETAASASDSLMAGGSGGCADVGRVLRHACAGRC